MLIAVASTDGEMVNKHFGRTTRFWIIDVSKAQHTLIMVRNVEPLSTRDENHAFDPARMAKTWEVIKERQRKGIAKANQMGKQINRKHVLDDKQIEEIKMKIAGGKSQIYTGKRIWY